ncbi:outer membrane protein assembly factor BamC [Actinobacillus succinogenes]|uniref:Outer membrane protein assembly factor BamC n=1 Tax=Actinobacillus succinogenes (strain ATCC 55618 / DSM 22257 / CCUG 43843 / 130Z) TaxID=339671 RepID=BAMC_ACTSZ|nr:outer membrane protein assembly factor BamC [Actinobacillus succinogenes]A6VKA3.1 RecName: Full=Outer membrane protein assembly factor BamC; Flags: Precursor [Actinobacillus succinogenes 130Z]ABR73400.1 NlpBDapX family lipoprotein [Actinobacillus succinogenes 130Z]PHI40133.1 outer membrane protein assembly factor BamC [Actinobacillus succinogenes]
MKKCLFPLSVLAVIVATGCGNTSPYANDSYEKHANAPTFTTIDTAGIRIIGQNDTYLLPATNVKKGENMDIRPPAIPMAIIGNSVAQFDGERASIIYPSEKAEVYNIRQMARLLEERSIKFTTKDNQIETDWTNFGAKTDQGETLLRYQINQVGNQEANALVVSVLEAKRDDILFTPSQKEKERYTSSLLNQFIGELNADYRSQAQAVATPTTTGPVQTAIITDGNNHLALAMSSEFQQSWSKLGDALPQLGFETEEETVGRGYRKLNYKPLGATEWARLGVNRPELEDGEYSMQISAHGKQSSVVISDEDGNAISGDAAQAMYRALANLISK